MAVSRQNSRTRSRVMGSFSNDLRWSTYSPTGRSFWAILCQCVPHLGGLSTRFAPRARTVEDEPPPRVIEDDAELGQHTRSDEAAALLARATASNGRRLHREAAQPEGPRPRDVSAGRDAEADAGFGLPAARHLPDDRMIHGIRRAGVHQEAVGDHRPVLQEELGAHEGPTPLDVERQLVAFASVVEA